MLQTLNLFITSDSALCAIASPHVRPRLKARLPLLRPTQHRRHRRRIRNKRAIRR